MADVNLSKAVRTNLLSLQSTAAQMSKTQNRLATGLKVNSALDNPSNFFTASARSLSPAIGQATHWPILRGGVPVTLQARIRECLELMGAAPFPAGSDELNNLEYFLTYLSNGLPLRANPRRP